MADPNALVAQAALLQAPLDVQNLVESGRWSPQTIGDIEWALECIAESEAEQAAIDQQLADLVARAQARAADIKAKAERRASFFRFAVAQYAEEHKPELLVGSKKSRDFLSGRIAWRKKGGKLTVTDRVALIYWLGDPNQPRNLSRIELVPDVKQIQAHFQATGVIPPGCDYEPERDELTIQAASLTTDKELTP